jgi:hypothetical protein
MGINPAGLRPPDCLAEVMLNTMYRYANRRVSKTEFERHDTITDERKVLSNIPECRCPKCREWSTLVEQGIVLPNGMLTNSWHCDLCDYDFQQIGEMMHIHVWLARRLKHKDKKGVPRHVIFGPNIDSAYWFSGMTSRERADIDNVWDVIEDRTDEVRTSDKNKLWPMTPIEKQHFLHVRVDDFTNEKMKDLESPLLDEEGFMLAKRKHKQNFEDVTRFPSLDRTVIENEIFDMDCSCDKRLDFSVTLDDTVEVKTA